jgi:hypothetical protein
VSLPAGNRRVGCWFGRVQCLCCSRCLCSRLADVATTESARKLCMRPQPPRATCPLRCIPIDRSSSRRCSEIVVWCRLDDWRRAIGGVVESGDTVANRSENRHSSVLGASSPTSFGCSKLYHSRNVYAGRATSSLSCRRCGCSSND